MAFFGDIFSEQPEANPTAWAQRILRVFARMGEDHPEQKQYFAEFDEEDMVAAELLVAASIAVEPPCLKAYSLKDNKLVLEFNDTYEKPPVRMIWHAVDQLKNNMLNCFQQVPGSDYYFVEDTLNSPLDLLGFIGHFSDDEHHAYPYYNLPEGVSFTTSDGKVCAGTCDYHAMLEFLEKHTYPDLKDNDIQNLAPCNLVIDKVQMQRIIDELGLGLEKGRKVS